jgi:E3 ubiquitin-protein ligase HERC1
VEEDMGYQPLLSLQVTFSDVFIEKILISCFKSGCYQWKFLIVKENRGNEGTCVGVSRYPIKDYNHRTTTDMWLYRAYRYFSCTLKLAEYLFLKMFNTIRMMYQDNLPCLFFIIMFFPNIYHVLFCYFSGNLYHNGELPLSLPSFTQGDYITAVLDMDARTLSFGKNGEEPRLAFEDIDSQELYPCVMFYSNSPGEQVCELYIGFTELYNCTFRSNSLICK